MNTLKTVGNFVKANWKGFLIGVGTTVAGVIGLSYLNSKNDQLQAEGEEIYEELRDELELDELEPLPGDVE